MLKKLTIIKFVVFLGALLVAGYSGVSQAEARASKAYCKTVKGPVYISKSKAKAKQLAYGRCARYGKGPWKFLSRKVTCTSARRRGKRVYRCRCVARICKARAAKPVKKTPAKAGPAKAEKPKAEKKKAAAPKAGEVKKAEPQKAEEPKEKKAEPKPEEKKPEQKKAE